MLNSTAESPNSAAKLELLRLLEEKARRLNRRRIDRYYPEEGPLKRALYPKHLEFFRLGARFNERAFIAGNRTGKTVAGAYEVTCHLTGVYPEWWEGKRFSGPVNFFVAGDTGKTVRDITQLELLGPIGSFGTGMIPGDLLERTTPKSGVPDAIETAYVRHTSGGLSLCQFKSYDQGRISFQGTAQHGVWLDEECPQDIYQESLLRTMTVDGIVMLTFTPLSGLTDVVLSFLPEFQPVTA